MEKQFTKNYLRQLHFEKNINCEKKNKLTQQCELDLRADELEGGKQVDWPEGWGIVVDLHRDTGVRAAPPLRL